MAKIDTPAPVAAPTPAAPTCINVATSSADVIERVRVVDAETGAEIHRVLYADSTTGQLTRFAIEDGSLVREGDAFKLVDETRAIRIEWIDQPQADA